MPSSPVFAVAHVLRAGRRTDTLSAEDRGRCMRRVRGKDTKPELTVRRLLDGLGCRYDLHAADLPGRPDVVLPDRRKVVFVHGCYWHLHTPCDRYQLPLTRREFWLPKLERNRERDRRNQALLHDEGWGVLVVWECELRDEEGVTVRLQEFLAS